MQDGRRLRSAQSRRAIKDAIRQQIQLGNYLPSSAQIATATGLSARTVFRHFEDMDSLSREISEDLEREVMPMFFRPYVSTDWRGKLRELIRTRAEVWEILFEIRLSTMLRRYKSEFVAVEYQKLLRLERDTLCAILPDLVLKDNATLNALLQCLSCASWIDLRTDLGCSADVALSTVELQVDRLMARHESKRRCVELTKFASAN